MKFRLFPVLILGSLILTGCGVKESTVPPPVEPQDLIEEAWAAYDSLNLDVSLAKFDTALNYMPTNSEAYLGKGMILGLKGKYGDAHGYLNLGVFAQGQSADLYAPSDTFTSWDLDSIVNTEILYTFLLRIPSEKQPMVFPVGAKGVQIKVDTMTQETIIKYKDLTLLRYSDSTVLYATSESSSFSFILLKYYYLRPNISYENDFPLFCYAANSAAYLAEEDFEKAIRTARSALLLKDQFVFEHYPYFDQRAIDLIEAYAAFRLGLYENTVEILVLLDSEWSPPEDPSDPDSYLDIIEELEHLYKLFTLPF